MQVVKEIEKKIREEGVNDEVFAKYAEDYSQCPSNVKGGLLGYFGKG
jgi:parvulin-like peptidyl-prolyl isomerase